MDLGFFGLKNLEVSTSRIPPTNFQSAKKGISRVSEIGEDVQGLELSLRDREKQQRLRLSLEVKYCFYQSADIQIGPAEILTPA